ncbi:hypothetical protein Q5P01_005826 [Channa striata]|uniref:MAGUK p55 subfamily member 4-like n=1 Tax=Channa striata TaxID=64152 RepID=A0AA88NGY9_CHASR|nr:hypothetical protein Q5P01_005826 [Channa striata]
MRQAVEAQVLHPLCDLGEHGLHQILTDAIEEARQSVNQGVDGAELLHSLLKASWMQPLLKVYECLQRYLRDSPAPALDYASGLSLQLLIDIRSSPGCSLEARELYGLLQQPHLQALLSAHDTVAQKDYDPVLPPMPEDLPDDEEATRLVCLVKNKQPLLCDCPTVRLLVPGASCVQSSRRDSLNCGTQHRLRRGGAFEVQRPTARSLDDTDPWWCSVRRGSYPQTEPPCCQSAAQPGPPPRYRPTSNCHLCCGVSRSQCTACYTKLLWEQSLNRSAPSVYSSGLIDGAKKGVDSGNDHEVGESSSSSQGRTTSPSCLAVPYCSPQDYYLQPNPPSRFRNRSPRIHTAPPSPMRPRRVMEIPPVELAKQESLDELRTTVQLAASSMETSTKDIKLLGEKMAAATERMTETVQDNSQALVLLTQVVDRLQMLLAATRTELSIPTPEQDSTFRKSPKAQRPRPSLTHQSRCSFPSLPSSSSSSLSSFVEAPSTSHGTSFLSVSCPVSPQTSLKTKKVPTKHTDLQLCKPPVANGLFDEPKEGSKAGATIKRSELTGEIFVARVIHGGLADRSGLLHAGDRILEVNGFPVDGMEPEQVIQVVQARSQGTVMFKVVPITERPVHNQTMLYVRAMADYSPQQDPTIPCADAGMSFRKGDVLEIVDQTDALWWQAKKLPCTEACAGLVPSTNLLKRKQREFWWSQPYQPHICTQTLSTVDEEDDLMAIDETCVEADEEAFESEEDDFNSNIEGFYLAGFRRSMRLCRRRSHSTTQPGSCHTRCPSSCYSALNCPYEEVVRYLRLPHDPHRLVALTGASGVGVNELRRNLIGMNPSIFQGATAHTTRAPKAYEEPGREYFFTSREIFDNMVYNNRFLEYGEHKGNLYGTSFESVMEAIQAVRTHELRAYIIYVKPPPLERLRETRQDSYITTNYCDSRLFKDEDFQEMEESARKIESQYWQLFDHVIVNDELQESCIQLLMAVRRAQEEPQWVPAAWIRPLTKA